MKNIKIRTTLYYFIISSTVMGILFPALNNPKLTKKVDHIMTLAAHNFE